MVKNIERLFMDISPSFSIMTSIVSNMATNARLVKRRCFAMRGVMMKSEVFRGFSFITLRDGGSEASAIAANVSIMRLTQSICVTVSGSVVPITAPTSTTARATKFMVSWNITKRCMFL